MTYATPSNDETASTLFINGAWEPAASGAVRQIHNPADGELAGGEELELLKSQIESGMQMQRGIILNDLNAFLRQVSLASDPAETQRQLKLIRESYEKRLSDI